jgi:fructose-specific phosphotransferase system component IIB
MRVETQGSMGIRDKITKQEIEEADVFINAADVAMLEPKRFKNVLTYRTTTSKIIKKGDKVLEEAIALLEE